MARPSTITADEIMQIARGLFLKQGIARTEMKQIAAACSISRTTLYRYFDSKESIAFGLVTETLEQLGTRAYQEHEGERVYETIKRSLISITSFMKQHPELLRLLDDFDCYFSDGYPEGSTSLNYQKFLRNQQPSMRELLKRGLSDGSIRQDIDADFYAQFMMNVLIGVAQRILPRQKIIRSEQGYGSEYIDEALQLILRDIKA